MSESPTAPAARPRGVLLDAFGTLIDMEPPAPLLASALERAGHPFPHDVVGRALRAEIRHYKANHLRGRDPASVDALRLECAGVLADALGTGAPAPAELLPLLLDSLRFRLLPDAAPALDALAAAGVPVCLVSNWDVSLRGVVERLGIADRLAAVCVSAEVGAAKPDPAIFRAALGALGMGAHEVVHCGDDPMLDGEGARAAGIRPVLIARAGEISDTHFTVISHLGQLAS